MLFCGVKYVTLVPYNISMPVTKFPCLTILLFCRKRHFQIFDQFRGLFKETDDKTWGAYNGKEKERKYVAKSCRQVTWAQKKVIKKRESSSKFLISKSLNATS